MKLQFYVFTKKAIRRETGNPFDVVAADRIFLAEGPPDSEGYITAWKIDIENGGLTGALSDVGIKGNCRIGPPITEKQVTEKELQKRIKAAYGRDSEPTANFKLDSYYQKVSFAQVRSMLRKSQK